MSRPHPERSLRELAQLAAEMHRNPNRHPLDIVLTFYKFEDTEKQVVVEEFHRCIPTGW